MAEKPGGGAGRELRTQPLWARVDANRVKLAVFVGLFVLGSSVLLTAAMVVLPAWLLTSFFGGAEHLPRISAIGFLLLVAIGGFLCAVQLANAEDWVRNRLRAGPPQGGQADTMMRAVSDVALAAGLREPPEVLVLSASEAVNAYAVGTRKRPVIGVTPALLETFTEDEQRAVAAALIARIRSGDIFFGTALAALMGPLKAFRDLDFGDKGAMMASAGSEARAGCGDGCADLGRGLDGCGCMFDALSDSDNAGGCIGAVGVALFLVFVAAVTYVAVRLAAWIVTLWGRLLQRTGHEKADAEGMLLLKHPEPMVSALRKALEASNDVVESDTSYDGILYTSTSGKLRLERAERRRLERLCEILGVDGALAWAEVPPAEKGGDSAE